MNLTLREEEPPIRCNRTIQQKTWESEGLERASELTLQNTRDLIRILVWNVEHDIKFYRCTSFLMTWNSEYEIDELPDSERIRENLRTAGDIVREHDMRFSFHPSHWCKPGSPDPDVIANTVGDLNNHGKWMDAMGLARTREYPINIHIGATYGDKRETARRVLENMNLLHPGARERLTLENDDNRNMWSVRDLVRLVGHEIPVTFDYHHHQFSSERPYRDGFCDALETWDVTPVTHYSEPARLWGHDNKPQKHSDYISEIPEWLVRESDVMVESKEKERAVLRSGYATTSVSSSG